MDIVERLAQQAAETINGGEFTDGTWYTEGQRQAWRKAMTPAADEIEQLQDIVRTLSLFVPDHDYAFMPIKMRKKIESLVETE